MGFIRGFLAFWMDEVEEFWVLDSIGMREVFLVLCRKENEEIKSFYTGL